MFVTTSMCKSPSFLDPRISCLDSEFLLLGVHCRDTHSVLKVHIQGYTTCAASTARWLETTCKVMYVPLLTGQRSTLRRCLYPLLNTAFPHRPLVTLLHLCRKRVGDALLHTMRISDTTAEHDRH